MEEALENYENMMTKDDDEDVKTMEPEKLMQTKEYIGEKMEELKLLEVKIQIVEYNTNIFWKSLHALH